MSRQGTAGRYITKYEAKKKLTKLGKANGSGLRDGGYVCSTGGRATDKGLEEEETPRRFKLGPYR